MDAQAQSYLNILNQKLNLLSRILEATKVVSLTGEGDDDNVEREAELFSSLYEQRVDVIEQIQKLDEDAKLFKDLKADTKADSLQKKIKQVAKEIVELDKKQQVASQKLMIFLRSNIKKIRDGRDASNAYADNYSTSGHYFDSAK